MRLSIHYPHFSVIFVSNPIQSLTSLSSRYLQSAMSQMIVNEGLVKSSLTTHRDRSASRQFTCCSDLEYPSGNGHPLEGQN